MAAAAGLPRQAGANIDRLIEIIMRFSYLVADYPEIKELDINPLLVTPEDVVALDARVVIHRDLVIRTVRPTRTWRFGPTRKSTWPSGP